MSHSSTNWGSSAETGNRTAGEHVGTTFHAPPLAHRDTRGHPHGKPSSWALIATVMIAFATGGVSIAVHAWWLFWVCAGVVVLAIPAGKAIGIMDDTVSWDAPASSDEDRSAGNASDSTARPT